MLNPELRFESKKEVQAYVKQAYSHQDWSVATERSDANKIIFKCNNVSGAEAGEDEQTIKRRRRNPHNTCPFRVRGNYLIKNRVWSLKVVCDSHNHRVDEVPAKHALETAPDAPPATRPGARQKPEASSDARTEPRADTTATPPIEPESSVPPLLLLPPLQLEDIHAMSDFMEMCYRQLPKIKNIGTEPPSLPADPPLLPPLPDEDVDLELRALYDLTLKFLTTAVYRLGLISRDDKMNILRNVLNYSGTYISRSVRKMVEEGKVPTRFSKNEAPRPDRPGDDTPPRLPPNINPSSLLLAPERQLRMPHAALVALPLFNAIQTGIDLPAIPPPQRLEKRDPASDLLDTHWGDRKEDDDWWVQTLGPSV